MNPVQQGVVIVGIVAISTFAVWSYTMGLIAAPQSETITWSLAKQLLYICLLITNVSLVWYAVYHLLFV